MIRVLRLTMLAALVGSPMLAAPAGAQDPAAITSIDSLLAPFFRDRSLLELTIVTDYKALTKDRTGEPQWQPAVIRLANGDSLEAQIRTRGNFRRRRCTMPPLKLDVPRGKANRTPLAGLNKPKIVTHCGNGTRYEQYVVQEYLLYRVYEQLTPLSHRGRLVRITYADAADRTPPEPHYAIVLEEDEDVAERTGLRLIDATGAGPDDLDPYHSALVGVFQYLIGNTDWSATALHNMVLLQSLTTAYPMAYDFDFAGAVSAPYAAPDPRLGIKSTRERLYRGFCPTADRWAEVFAHVRAQKEAIWALYQNEPALDARGRDRTLEYFEEFFRIIDDPGARDREIVRNCRR